MPSFTSLDGTQIEYRTRENGQYRDLDDPEDLQKLLLEKAPWGENVRVIESMKKSERDKRALALERLQKRLKELKYREIPDKVPGIFLFRAKHKLQCFEARLDHAKEAMSNPPKSRSDTLVYTERRKKFRKEYLPKLCAVLKDFKDTHSKLADSPEKVDLEHVLKRFEILIEQYTVLCQKRDKYDRPLTSTHGPGSGRHNNPVAHGSRSGTRDVTSSSTVIVKPRSGTHSPAPESTSFRDKSESEDDEFSQLTDTVYKESARGLNRDENWLEQFL